MSLESYGNEVVNASSALISGEFNNLCASLKGEVDELLKLQVKKLQDYNEQLQKFQITKEEYESNVEDVKTLLAMETQKVSMQLRVSYQKIVKGITDILINNLSKLF
jgi:hypothetical protein